MFSLPLNIQQSITINKPLAEVFTVVANFNTWPSWSPWLCMEPDCPLEIVGNPGEIQHHQKWHGKRIGAGEMHLTQITPQKSLEYNLVFIKPWKSKNLVRFEFKEAENGTELCWIMRGSIPIFLFFMRKMMIAMVGSDYKRGLNMLKEYLETGTVNSKMNFTGLVDCDAFYYLGKRHHCATSEVGPAMDADFTDLKNQLNDGKLAAPDFMFSIYHQYDLVSQQCEYTSGFAYKNPPKAKSNLESGEFPQHKAISLEHLGTYQHLGNAWSALQSMLRESKKKQSKKIPMYEIYGNFPGQVPDKDIKTNLFLPIND